MAVETIPPELRIKILLSVDSLQDLYRIISASPLCLRAFSRTPQLFLTTVLKRCIPEPTLRHCLAILNVPPQTGDNERQWQQEQIPPFIDHYVGSQPFPFPTRKEDLVLLSRQYRRPHYFTEQFFRAARRLLDSEPRPDFTSASDTDNTAPTRASLLESDRIQVHRAFLRLELFFKSSIYGGDCVRTDHSHLVSRLPLWALEEIHCAYKYFEEIMRLKYDNLRVEYMYTVMKAPGAILGACKSDGVTRDFDLPDQFVFANDPVHTSLHMFSKSGYGGEDGDVFNLTSLGLDFWYRLVRGNETEAADLIRAHCPSKLPLGFPPFNLDVFAYLFRLSASTSNLNNDPPPCSGLDFFRDRERMGDLTNFQCSQEMRRFRLAYWRDRLYPVQEQQRVMLPLDELRNIEAQFGSTNQRFLGYLRSLRVILERRRRNVQARRATAVERCHGPCQDQAVTTGRTMTYPLFTQTRIPNSPRISEPGRPAHLSTMSHKTKLTLVQ
jgi:hypothetical protein